MLKCRTDCLSHNNMPALPQYFLKCEYFCKSRHCVSSQGHLFSRSEQSDIWALVKIHPTARWHLAQLTVWEPQLEVYYLFISFFKWIPIMQSENHIMDHKTQLKYSKRSLKLKYSNWRILAPLKTDQGKRFVSDWADKCVPGNHSRLGGGFICWERNAVWDRWWYPSG